MFRYPSRECTFDALLSIWKLVQSERCANKVVQRTGWLIKGLPQGCFIKPHFRGVEATAKLLPFICGNRFSGKDLTNDRILLLELDDLFAPLVLIFLSVN